MFLRHTTANQNVSRGRSLQRLSAHGSLLSIFRGGKTRRRFRNSSLRAEPLAGVKVCAEGMAAYFSVIQFNMSTQCYQSIQHGGL